MRTHAIQLLVHAVDQWKAFLATVRATTLRAEIRGVLGELWFGFSRVIESVSPSTVLRAWTGPFGSPQDFNLPSGQSYEVKTVHSDTKSVRISSAEQLDPGARSLELAVVTVTDVDESTDNALSLPSMVERVKAMLDENNNDVDELRVRFRR